METRTRRVSTLRSPVTSFSAHNMLTTCQRKWAFKYRDHAPETPTKAMLLGSTVHRLWAAHITGGDWRHRARQIGQEWVNDNPEATALPEWLDTAIWILGRYQDHYQDVAGWEVVAVEVPFEIRLPRKTGWLIGYIDAVVRIGGLLYLVELKTMSDWGKLDTLVWDPQSTCYIYAARQLGYDIESLIFDAARTYRWKAERPTHESFQRVPVDRNEEHLTAAIAEMSGGIDLARAILKGQAPLRSLDLHCSWCSYKTPCISELAFGSEPEFFVEDDE